MIETSMVAFLKNDPAVASLIAARLYPQKSPQAKNATAADYPRAIYQRVVTIEQVKSQDGMGPLTQARVQFDCQALSELDARRLAAKIKASTGGVAGGQALNGWKQALMGGIKLQGCWLAESGEAEDYTPPLHADDVGVYHYYVDLIAWYEEPVTP